jgi:hypothetical protein
VGVNLEADKGSFSNPKGNALNADVINVAGSVFLRDGFNSTGEVRLPGATIGGVFDCSNATFSNADGFPLVADGIKVAGTVFLNKGFSSNGYVRLPDATVGGNLECDDATFAPGKGLVAERVRVSGELYWTGIADGTNNTVADKRNPNVLLDLEGSSTEILADAETSWPTPNKVDLDGFTYSRFAHRTDVPHDAASRIKWLRLQNRGRPPATQPYQQLAKVLESEGDEHGARDVRIAVQDALLPFLPWYTRLWRRILKYTVGYGYEPWLALCWAFVFIACGYILFALGYRDGVFAPTDKDAFAEFHADQPMPGYQPFNAFVYSLDTFLPIINLGLKDNWMPDPNLQPRPKAVEGTYLGDFVSYQFRNRAGWHFFHSGQALRVYFWIHVLFGWGLITLFVAGFTGIIRR